MRSHCSRCGNDWSRPRNARFKVYVNGADAVLTLRPGQSLTWSRSGRTDEGWDAEGNTWTHEGDAVRCQSWSDGRDCDGRFTTGNDAMCALDQLHAHSFRTGETVETGWPAWESTDHWQRDYAAEAAGY